MCSAKSPRHAVRPPARPAHRVAVAQAQQLCDQDVLWRQTRRGGRHILAAALGAHVAALVAPLWLLGLRRHRLRRVVWARVVAPAAPAPREAAPSSSSSSSVPAASPGPAATATSTPASASASAALIIVMLATAAAAPAAAAVPPAAATTTVVLAAVGHLSAGSWRRQALGPTYWAVHGLEITGLLRCGAAASA